MIEQALIFLAATVVGFVATTWLISFQVSRIEQAMDELSDEIRKEKKK